MKKKIGDLSIRQFKEIKKQCENCERLIENCNKCEKENPNLYALCDIELCDITDNDMEKEIEAE